MPSQIQFTTCYYLHPGSNIKQACSRLRYERCATHRNGLCVSPYGNLAKLSRKLAIEPVTSGNIRDRVVLFLDHHEHMPG